MQPHETAAQPESVAQQDTPTTRSAGPPVLTYAMLAALFAIFACELMFGIGRWEKLLQPSILTLLAFGGLQYPLVVDLGQWYRMFSAPLLHVDAMHLLFNCYALFLAGAILESLVGRAWLAALFVVGGLGGALMSLALNPSNLVSVGASGAIMGLFAAILVLSYHY